jgi:aminoglycoside phosphotransferase (APT) family kinase protein
MTSSPQLQGLSGANLRIVAEPGGIVIRKTAASTAGNERLRRQEAKQREFIALGGPLGAPAILDSGLDPEGRFYFDMEFIGGQDGHRFLERCSPVELESFTSQLVDHIAVLKALPMIGGPGIHASLYDACVHKLAEVVHRDVGLGDSLAGCILRNLSAVRHLDIVGQGFCHGDFTLENILVDMHGGIHLVDFLDSTFEHPLQDLVKLSQDLHGGWFHARGKRISSAVISFLERRLQPVLDEAFPYYPDVRDTLQAVNFCRILPYVHDESQKSFVLKKIKLFTQQPT